MDELEPRKKYDETRDLPEYIKVKPSQKPDDKGSIWTSLGILFGGISILFVLMLIFVPGAGIIFVMWLASAPQSLRLPYNAIDFQKIAYIDNQFVMYGIDYDKSNANQLVIFNSVDGKEWDKSKVKISDHRDDLSLSTSGTFAYFKGKCYLIGVTDQPLVADDCKHWQTQTVNKIADKSNYFYNAHSSAITKNELYIGGEKGVYKTSDGMNWTQEQLPYPEESNQLNFENRFYSMAFGNNKLITTSNWWQDKKRRGIIYTKDLATNRWSYEIYHVPVGNITRGKDRFVGMTESSALVLVDGEHKHIEILLIKSNYNSLIFGLKGEFIGTNPIKKSTDGIRWTLGKNFGGGNIACNNQLCITVGHEYHVFISSDGIHWAKSDFNHKNSEPGWWRRFF